MSNRFIAGIFFCFLVIASFYIVVIESLTGNHLGYSTFSKISIVVLWLFLTKLFMSQNAREIRQERIGSSNFFVFLVSLFKKDK